MKLTRPHPALIVVLLALPTFHHQAQAASAPDLIAAVKAGDGARAKELAQSPDQLKSRDARGNTALHWAALANDERLVKHMLAAGADIRATNSVGATPLHYGTGSEAIVRDLLRAGADPNAKTISGSTPLHTAASRPGSYRSVKQLLDAGAEVDARRTPAYDMGALSALTLAVYYGDPRAARLLIDRGASPGGTNGFTPVAAAAFTGKRDLLETLVARGGAVNFDEKFAGHGLNNALYTDHQHLARFLVEHGSDLHQPSSFGERVPPMVWSAYNETGDASIARLLIEHGLNVNEVTGAGHTALDWAVKRGDTPLVAYLRTQGATNSAPATRAKAVPQNAVPADAAGRAAALRDSVQRAIDLLQRSSDGFLANGFVKQSGCVSCHQQTLPAVAFGRAQERGFRLDEASLARQLHTQHASWSKSRDAAYEMTEPLPDFPTTVSYGMFGLKSLGYAPDELTDAMVWYLAKAQLPDGAFPGYDRRPPMEEGQVISTAMAMGALRHYPQPIKSVDLDPVFAKGRRWLAKVEPKDLNQQVFRLLGLGWAGAKPSELKRHVRELLASQSADGGWAPLPGLASDAWATGMTLFVLHEVGGIAADDEHYRRGVDFLLRTQFADGSWFVASRTWPFQPHFDSGFPHGKDQWISAGGTAWAVIALLNEIEPVAKRESFPSAQVLMAKHPKPAAESSKTAADSAPTTTAAAPADPVFTRDILPIFQKTCFDCHSGEKLKGDFSLETVAGLLKGGQSGEPAIVPGKPDASPLIRMVTDQVEDLEMPPLGKRAKYPALTKDEITRLREWIELAKTP